MLKSPTQSLKAVKMIEADNHAVSTVNGPAIDTLGFEDLMVIVNSGANGASGTVDVKLQESDASGSGFADITGATFTQIVGANDNAIYVAEISLRFTKRYVRAVAVVGTAACDFGAVGVLCNPHVEPVSQAAAVAFALKND